MRVRLKLTSVAPLIMHNDTLADPLHPVTQEYKKLTAKRKKSDQDYQEIYRLEFLAGLYCLADLGPHIPAENLMRCLQDAAKRTKQGEIAKRAILILDTEVPLAYSGPRTPGELWADERFRDARSTVVNRGSRTMRMRPIFHPWAADARIELDTELLNLHDFVAICETAGRWEGLMELRPRYGRFEATVEPEVWKETGGRMTAASKG